MAKVLQAQNKVDEAETLQERMQLGQSRVWGREEPRNTFTKPQPQISKTSHAYYVKAACADVGALNLRRFTGVVRCLWESARLNRREVSETGKDRTKSVAKNTQPKPKHSSGLTFQVMSQGRSYRQDVETIVPFGPGFQGIQFGDSRLNLTAPVKKGLFLGQNLGV